MVEKSTANKGLDGDGRKEEKMSPVVGLAN
jgi:hypothetical protein